MEKFKAQKLVEQLLINSIMYKNVDYEITQCSKSVHTYNVHNLKANIEDGVVWFSDNRLDFVIDSIFDVIVLGKNIEVKFKDATYINIKAIN